MTHLQTSRVDQFPGSLAAPAETPFDQLLQEVLDVAYRAAYALSRESADAEDLVQEAALPACRYRTSFEPGTNFRAWFLRILTNVFHSRCRKASVRRESVSLDEAAEPHVLALAWSQATVGDEDPAQSTLDRLDAEQIRGAIAALPVEFRVVTTMYLVEAMDYKDIATAAGIPIGTVRSRLHRGRRLLKESLRVMAADHGLLPAEA